MPRPKRRTKTGGRKKGTPNKATADARAAIAAFVEGNIHELQDWLDRTANGTPADRRRGIRAVPPDPAKAFSLVQSLIEYLIPKLARLDATDQREKEPVRPLAVRINFVDPPKRSGGITS